MAHVAVVRRSISLEQWSKVQFDRVAGLVVTRREPLSGWTVQVGQYHPSGYVWDDPQPRPISEGEFWGRPDGTAVFRCRASIPPSLAGQDVHLEFLTGAEVLVWNHGKLVDGIDPNRPRMLLTRDAAPHLPIDLMLEAYVRSQPDDQRSVLTRQSRGCVQPFRTPTLLTLDRAALALQYDLHQLYLLAFHTGVSDDLKGFLASRIERLLSLFPAYDAPATELRSRISLLRDFLAREIYSDKLPFGRPGRLACVAHSHLDIAYHWKVEQTHQKNARTCLIQLRLMDRFPDFRFTHSQAWCYESLEQHYPELFQEVKQRIVEGRWEIVGGMYVEPDCNLPCAESMARQILYGKRYFLEKFGVEVDNCWLPDVFGNSPILPQLLRHGGIDCFVSNKMSTWNDTNRFPHNHFIWRGIDGSEVFACVPPVHFITWMEPSQSLENWRAFQDKDACNESLQMYGFGDGGSGVTDEMLEHFQRLNRLPEMPHHRFIPARQYLHEQLREKRDQLSVWDGELYLEMHRGTFTTKHLLKQQNRRGETLAVETEFLCTLAMLQGADYPEPTLGSAWKKLLLNQFHDILPGSQVEPAFVEAMNTYREMTAQFVEARTAALDRLAPRGSSDEVCVINGSSDPRTTLCVLDTLPDRAHSLQLDDGTIVPVQLQRQPFEGSRPVALFRSMPGLGVFRARAREASVPTGGALFASSRQLESPFYLLTLDERHRLVSLFDKRRGREVLSGEGNQWQLFEDKPGNYNAWDIISHFEDHPIELPDWDTPEIVEHGPIGVAWRLRRRFGLSRAEQVIRVYADLPRVEFETWIDWQEQEKLLKVAFPLTIHARHYTTDTSAGGLERANHRNTSWQQARFEVCCHKWVDLSEGHFGVALLNESSYGCDVRGNVVRLSLLKAPIRPDPVSDRGEHRLTYALTTHDGDWRRGAVVEQAIDLNAPPVALVGRSPGEARPPLVALSTSSVKVQAVKRDEEGRGDVVVRLVELHGSRGTLTLTTGFDFRSAVLCDLLERTTASLQHVGREVRLEYRPYQVQTLRFHRQ